MLWEKEVVSGAGDWTDGQTPGTDDRRVSFKVTQPGQFKITLRVANDCSPVSDPVVREFVVARA